MASDKQAKDATEAALSAIEEALAATGTDGPAAKPSAAKGEAKPADNRAATQPAAAEPVESAQRGVKLPRVAVAETVIADRKPAAVAAEAAPPAPAVAAASNSAAAAAADIRQSIARPANDEQQTLAPLIAQMQKKPSRRPFWIAAIAALGWIAAFAAFVMWRNQIDTPQALMAQPPQMLAVLAFLVVAPVVFFFVLAGLAWRTQEMKLSTQAVAQVARRLTEPESLASDSMERLSQAIRREVAAMGDGIERAVARAGELETIVHSEISNLERAYADNEIRIRGLVDELITQREAIASNADRVKLAITGAHEGLAADL
ncbi:MAG: hypothetical protein ACRCYS_10645, partial [Beijerinckiaceae bacterium]